MRTQAISSSISQSCRRTRVLSGGVSEQPGSPRPPDRIRVVLELATRRRRWRVRPVLVGCVRCGSGDGPRRRAAASVHVNLAHARAQMVEQLDAGGRVDGRRADVGRQVVGHLGGAVRETGAELVRVHGVHGPDAERVVLLQFVQVAHRQLQYVGLLQLAHVLTLGLQRHHHQVLEFVQAPVDASAAFPFQKRFHNLTGKKIIIVDK
uniref:Uncharacterized protein n=1 Tax=Sipha flava TaxID=143950 RepID=A0A2S2R9D0_9HEMI